MTATMRDDSVSRRLNAQEKQKAKSSLAPANAIRTVTDRQQAYLLHKKCQGWLTLQQKWILAN